MFDKTSRNLNRRGIRFLLAWLWSKIVLAALLGGAAVGLTFIAFQPTKQNAAYERLEEPGSGITVQIDLTDIWVPRQLYELARSQCANPKLASEEALKRQLRNDGLENLWFAGTLALHQPDGGISLITTIDHPCASTTTIPSLFDLLDEIGGSPKNDSSAPRSAPRVHVIPEELLSRPPSNAVNDLLQERSSDR